eukprot:217824-Pelagomonas_calceolata.AAC.2
MPEVQYKKEKDTVHTVNTLPTSIKEMRIPMAEALCIPFTKWVTNYSSRRLSEYTSSSASDSVPPDGLPPKTLLCTCAYDSAPVTVRLKKRLRSTLVWRNGEPAPPPNKRSAMTRGPLRSATTRGPLGSATTRGPNKRSATTKGPNKRSAMT